MAETLILVDGNALVHRAFHAVQPLTTSKGELVNAVYGFAAMLLKAIADLRPSCVAVAFDLEAEAGPIARLMTRYADVPMSLADACLVRMTELQEDSLVLTMDQDFHVYRRHGRQTIHARMPAD